MLKNDFGIDWEISSKLNKEISTIEPLILIIDHFFYSCDNKTKE